MTTHSSILAWTVPWTEEAGGLQSIGLHRVWHDWSDLAYMLTSWSTMVPYKWLLLLAGWVVIPYQLCWEVHVIKPVCSLHMCHCDLLVPLPLSKHWNNWAGGWGWGIDSYRKDNFVHVVIERLLCHGGFSGGCHGTWIFISFAHFKGTTHILLHQTFLPLIFQSWCF